MITQQGLGESACRVWFFQIQISRSQQQIEQDDSGVKSAKNVVNFISRTLIDEGNKRHRAHCEIQIHERRIYSRSVKRAQPEVGINRPINLVFGRSLAYTELYLTLGHVFRKFEVTVHGTSDVDMEWTECGVARTVVELKVKLREANY